MRKAWDVPGAMFGMMPGRVTYVIDKVYSHPTHMRGIAIRFHLVLLGLAAVAMVIVVGGLSI